MKDLNLCQTAEFLPGMGATFLFDDQNYGESVPSELDLTTQAHMALVYAALAAIDGYYEFLVELCQGKAIWGVYLNMCVRQTLARGPTPASIPASPKVPNTPRPPGK